MARRWASTACVTSSKLTSENELPSGSLKRAKTPPQIGGCSAASDDEAAEPAVCTRTGYLSRLSRGLTKKRTPRALHSRNLASTSSVTNVTWVYRPMSLCWSESRSGATRVRFAVPSGGATNLTLVAPERDSDQHKLIGR